MVKTMAKIKVKQIRSSIDKPARQKKTLVALGIKKMHQTVEHEATPQILGMINKVQHLVEVSE
jgi:large subunit ribosomal protein L30